MADPLHSLLLVLVMAAGTAALRFLPFVLFPEGKSIPRMVAYLSSVLPAAVMGMLVVYCLKSVSLTAWPFALPEALAVAATAALHCWKHNTLLSILAGTVLYMALIQLVF